MSDRPSYTPTPSTGAGQPPTPATNGGAPQPARKFTGAITSSKVVAPVVTSSTPKPAKDKRANVGDQSSTYNVPGWLESPIGQSEILVLLAVAAVIFCLHLWRGGFAEEYLAADLARRPTGEVMAERLRAGDLPAYTVAMKPWTSVMGDRPIMLRLPSLLLGLASVFFVIQFLTEVTCSATTRIASWLYIGHQTVIWSAQTALPFAAVLAATTGAAWCLAVFLKSNKRGYLLAAGVLLAVGALFHMTAGFTALAMLVAVVGMGVISSAKPELAAVERERAISGSVGLLVANVVIWVGYISFRQKYGYAGPAEPIDLAAANAGLARASFGDFRNWMPEGAWPQHIAMLLLLVGIAGATASGLEGIKLHRARRLFGAGFFWPWALVPFAGLCYAETRSHVSLLDSPYAFACMLPGLIALMATGFRHWIRVAPPVGCVLLGAAAVFMLPSTAAWIRNNGDGPRELKPLLGDDVKVFAGDIIPIRYEWGAQGADRVFSLLSRESRESIERVIIKWNDTQPRFWMIFYTPGGGKISPDDARKQIVDYPPEGWSVRQEVEAGAAKAYLMAYDPNYRPESDNPFHQKSLDPAPEVSDPNAPSPFGTPSPTAVETPAPTTP